MVRESFPWSTWYRQSHLNISLSQLLSTSKVYEPGVPRPRDGVSLRRQLDSRGQRPPRAIPRGLLHRSLHIIYMIHIIFIYTLTCSHSHAASLALLGKLGQHSYVVLRDEEGALRAFYNVCRHHAMCLLTEPQGTAKQVCHQVIGQRRAYLWGA